MQVSPLQLKQHFLTKISVDQRNKAPSEPTFGVCDFSNVEVQVTLEHGAASDEVKDPRNFILRLGLTFDGANKAKIPYDLVVEMVGFFEVAPVVEKEKRSALVLANGAAILYGAAREVIASLSGRFAKGIVILPSVNFIDDANRYEKDMMKASGALRSKPKKSDKEDRAEATAKATK